MLQFSCIVPQPCMLLHASSFPRKTFQSCKIVLITKRHCSCIIRCCKTMTNVPFGNFWHLCVSHLDFDQECVQPIRLPIPIGQQYNRRISESKVLRNIFGTENFFLWKLPTKALYFQIKKSPWRCEIYGLWEGIQHTRLLFLSHPLFTAGIVKNSTVIPFSQ